MGHYILDPLNRVRELLTSDGEGNWLGDLGAFGVLDNDLKSKGPGLRGVRFPFDQASLGLDPHSLRRILR